MATSIPIKDLKNTGDVSELCHRSTEPVLVTKNGYPDFYLVSPEMMGDYQVAMARQELYERVARGEQDIANGRVSDVREDLAKIRSEHGL